MSFTRRTFLLGAASGLSVLVLAACTDSTPVPSPTPTPTEPTNELPVPTSFSRSNWASDPYALGATSYLAVGALPQSREWLRNPVLNRIFLAGEAISDEPGTIRGAIDSGRSAAREVLSVVGDGERVAVIGAGASGARAARLLASNGVDVVVIEARDRTGGRIDSRVENNEFFELGAWRLAATDDADLVEMLASEDVAVEPLANSSAYALREADAPAELASDNPALAAAVDSLDTAAVWARQQPQDVSLTDAVTEGGSPDSWPASGVTGVTPDLLTGQLIAAVSSLTGADPTDLSSWFSAFPSGTESVVPTGPLSTIVDTALDGIDTFLSSTVVGIFYDDDGVSLRLGTGESLTVDRVVVTVPLGVLQEQVIEFDPPLPVAHRGAIGALSVGHLEVIRLEYETAFWDTDAVWWVREDRAEDDPIQFWVNLQPATGRPVLLGIVAGEAAVTLADVGDDALLEMAQKSLEPFVPPAT